jgi:hypothetical protein
MQVPGIFYLHYDIYTKKGSILSNWRRVQTITCMFPYYLSVLSALDNACTDCRFFTDIKARIVRKPSHPMLHLPCKVYCTFTQTPFIICAIDAIVSIRYRQYHVTPEAGRRNRLAKQNISQHVIKHRYFIS